MNKLIFSTAIFLVSCGPDAVQRASDNPWSSKNDSVAIANNTVGVRVETPMVVDGNTVRKSALSILNQAASSKDARLRANAIEALQFGPKDQLIQAVRLGLGDENRGVRFVATMTIGEENLCEISTLLEPLLLDESKSVQAAALYAMYKCGRDVDLNPLASMLYSENPELRGNAALVLGQMGNKSAVPMLRKSLKVSSSLIAPIRRRLINLQIAEALVLLGEQQELEVIRAAIFSSTAEAEITAMACQIAGELRDIEVISTLEGILLTPARYPDEVRLVAATSLAEIAPSRMPLEPVLRFTSSNYASLRSQCAAALGAQGNQLSLGPLTLMMEDSDPLVQISAAGGVLRINNADSITNID